MDCAAIKSYIRYKEYRYGRKYEFVAEGLETKQ